MRTSKELKVLSNNIGKAIFAYHDAVKENLKESGNEYGVYGVYGDEYLEDDEVEAVRLTTFTDDGDGVVVMDIDKVRYNKEYDVVEVHVRMEDYRKCDWWYFASLLGDTIDYVYDAIKWEDD